MPDRDIDRAFRDLGRQSGYPVQKLLDEPVPLGNEMAALLTVIGALDYLPPHLSTKAASLARRWAARYDRVDDGL